MQIDEIGLKNRHRLATTTEKKLMSYTIAAYEASIHTVSLLPAEWISPFCGILTQNVAMNG